METSLLPVKGCKFFTFARHSWPLSNEGSLTCHTCCDTGIPFIMVISEDPWHLHLLPSVWQASCHYLFLWLSLSIHYFTSWNDQTGNYLHPDYAQTQNVTLFLWWPPLNCKCDQIVKCHIIKWQPQYITQRPPDNFFYMVPTSFFINDYIKWIKISLFHRWKIRAEGISTLKQIYIQHYHDHSCIIYFSLFSTGWQQKSPDILFPVARKVPR